MRYETPQNTIKASILLWALFLFAIVPNLSFATGAPAKCTLEITKSVNKSLAVVGDELIYTITVKNIGKADCTGSGVKIKDIVDTKLQFVSEMHSANIVAGYDPAPLYTASTRMLLWNADKLSPNESGSITWKARIIEPLSCGSFTVFNKASVTSAEYNHFNTWVESAAVTTTVSNDCIPALAGVCAATPSSVLMGNPVTYTATASGGIGSYTYDWTGTDGLEGTNVSAAKTYSTSGTKQAHVVITSGSQSVTAHCEASVTDPPLPESATLKVVKHVVNDNGGTKTASDFIVFVKQNGSHELGSPTSGSTSGTVFTLSAGSYIVGENDPSLLGYAMDGITGDCSSSGSVTLVAGDTKTCTITNNDMPSSQPPSLSVLCVADVSSTEINQTVTWSATASGGIGSYTYDWTGTDGLEGATQTLNTSYTSIGIKNAQVTATSGAQSETAECSIVIVITPPPPTSTPLSALCTVSPSTIRAGESAQWSATASGGTGSYTYDWTGTDGLEGTIPILNKLYPTLGTKKGTVTVTSGSETATASCALNVIPPQGGCSTGCGGGGFNAPTVVLLKKPPEGRVLSAVYLSQIPYTGIGDWYKVPLFIIILALWSASVVYFFHSKIWRHGKRKREEHIFAPTGTKDTVFEIRGEEAPVGDLWTSGNINHVNEPTMQINEAVAKTMQHQTAHSSRNVTTMNNHSSAGVIDVVAAEAQRNHAVISEEGMHFIVEKSGNNATRAMALVESVVKNAEALFDRDEGWLLLNKEKVITSLSENARTTPKHHAETPSSHAVAPQQHTSVSPPHSENAHFQSAQHVDSTLFISWLASGDRIRVMRHLKSLRERQGAAEAFLKKAVLELDIVHRSRFEDSEKPFDEHLAHTVSGLSNNDLEELIATLLSMTDEHYHSASLNVKLALMRVGEIGKSR